MSLKDKILEESLKLFIENGIEGTSIKAIAQASGTSNGGLYHHFSSKEEIALIIYTDIKKELLSNIAKIIDNNVSTRELLFMCWKERIKTGLADPEKLRFLKAIESKISLTDFVKKSPSSGFEKLTDELKIRMEKGDLILQDFEYLSLYFLSSTDTVINYLTSHKEKISEEFIAEKYRYFWRSIVNI